MTAPNASPAAETRTFLVRLTPRQHDRLRALADAGHRSLAAQIRLLIDTADDT